MDDPKTFKELLIQGHYFCFCIPTRYAVMIEAILTVTIASFIATLVWYEVDSMLCSTPLIAQPFLIF